ncbi:MAG: type II toxin-antitoxin system VapC family toxin [Verrucomicrobiaceae bacterium]|nr:type II toxin-antitoxin system VapC family toxin [Verrucomicrobiaceae bacterium]
MSYLVDTNVFSELAKSKPDATVVTWLRDHEPQLYVSTITIGELRRGIERLPSGKKRTALQSWLSGLCQRMDGRVLSFNVGIAHVWGQLLAGWEKKGIVVPSLDSQLAATAHRHGLTMVTRNVTDFQNTGVKLLNPFET